MSREEEIRDIVEEYLFKRALLEDGDIPSFRSKLFHVIKVLSDFRWIFLIKLETKGRHPGPEPGLILKTGTATIQNLLDLGPGLKSEKSGTRDWDRDASRNPGPDEGFRDSTLGDCSGDWKFSGTRSWSRADPFWKLLIWNYSWILVGDRRRLHSFEADQKALAYRFKTR